MFMLVLMSPGERDKLIIDIQNWLSPKQFPAMKGKPKVMIVQTCPDGE